VSSARNHAVGGATLPRGGDDAIVAVIDVSSREARATGGGELVHPMPLGQDGHEGVFPSSDGQQSTRLTVDRGCTDAAPLERTCRDSAEATS
jgi:hypothetical protein